MHPRLTVAIAPQPDRATVAAALAGVVIGTADLWSSADALAAERSGERAAARSRLDAAVARTLHGLETARSQHEHLESSRRGLLDGAAWSLELDTELPSLHEAAEAARATMEERLAEQRSARQGLERVLEQRAAAAAAIEEADKELGELAGVGMDESGLRRELEASGQAVRSAQDAHARAAERTRALRAEQADLAARLAELQGTDGAAGRRGLVDPRLVEQVRQHLSAWAANAGIAGLDPQAQALADAWSDLLADLAELSQQTGPPPSQAELAQAEGRVAHIQQSLEQLGGDTQVIDPTVRAELDAAHDAVLAAEERTGRRLGAGAARKALDLARATERVLLDRYGFATYIDVVLTGGRSSSDTGERMALERAYVAAVAERDLLLAGLEPSPELEYLRTERARLHDHAVELLGVDPGDQVVTLLRTHPLLPRSIVEGLREGLERAGVRPVGVGLADAATQWLAEQDAAAVERDRHRDRADRVEAEATAIATRQAALDEELAAAVETEAHAAEQLELSLRSVDAFEAELSVRAGEDAPRLQRFAAAEQLRTQVEALAATLARAEGAARETLERAASSTAEAEVVVDRILATLTEHARKARRLAAELPIDQRPEGDPLATLVALAERLRAHVEVLEPEIRATERAVATAAAQLDDAQAIAQAASTGLEGPLAEDLTDGFSTLLAAPAEQLVVLDEPFVGLDENLRPALLDQVLERSATGPIVLLTEDPDLLGWAIELPADVAAAVPADSLLTAIDLSQPTAAAPTAITTAPAPRWAGQR